MSQQPEALRLADAMEGSDAEYPDDLEVADELRRLHVAVEMLEAENFRRYRENEKMERINAQLLEALEAMVVLAAPNIYVTPDKPNSAWAKLEQARAAIAAASDETSR